MKQYPKLNKESSSNTRTKFNKESSSNTVTKLNKELSSNTVTKLNKESLANTVTIFNRESLPRFDRQTLSNTGSKYSTEKQKNIIKKKRYSFRIENQHFVCQEPHCKNLVYVNKYKGEYDDFRCPTCMRQPFVSPGNAVKSNTYTNCVTCRCFFKVFEDFQGKNPKCPTHRFKKCVNCPTIDNTVTYGPHPYNSEVNGDKTDVWMCHDCRYDATMEV